MSCQVAVFFSPDRLGGTGCISFPWLFSGVCAPRSCEVQAVAITDQRLETTWKLREGGAVSSDFRLCLTSGAPSSTGPIPGFHCSVLISQCRLQLASECLNIQPFNTITSECPLSAGDKAKRRGKHTAFL